MKRECALISKECAVLQHPEIADICIEYDITDKYVIDALFELANLVYNRGYNDGYNNGYGDNTPTTDW